MIICTIVLYSNIFVQSAPLYQVISFVIILFVFALISANKSIHTFHYIWNTGTKWPYVIIAANRGLMKSFFVKVFLGWLFFFLNTVVILIIHMWLSGHHSIMLLTVRPLRGLMKLFHVDYVLMRRMWPWTVSCWGCSGWSHWTHCIHLKITKLWLFFLQVLRILLPWCIRW